MPSSSLNNAIVAAAGSGKTEEIVTRALALPPEEGILITTYTSNGAAEIRNRIISKTGVVPPNIRVIPWLTFLIRHGIKPYQSEAVDINQVSGLHFDRRLGYPRKTDVRRYYLDSASKVYRDYLAEFACLLNDKSNGAVVKRIAAIFPHIFYDEIQDISGRDFEFIELLMDSTSSVTVVGDPRQGTFSTTQSRTNKGMTKSDVVNWVEKLEASNKIKVYLMTHSYRCRPEICDLADALYPDLAKTESRNPSSTIHDGVFLVRTEDVSTYLRKHDPQVLVWDKRSETFGANARNMGEVKGLTFERVLINPTAPISKYLQKGSDLAAGSRAKFYVGVTRARQSVGIILDLPGRSDLPVWNSEN
ncbi:UvrD-helicase domain-containing protein [Salinibacterium sp. NG22]|uniref:UvrD-helicase domain-containing protein n=1 Tax=Salinibacterium sp. NG22 TaxID=2792040 RepID=UPI0018CEA2E4|nr:UvrD-helicase domain-containing protein [Salinibacterium sp. NG22]MBH0109363.1 UvrD-helicase domain-containing protein [Salinibacterium sp. NG22]